MKNVFPVIFLLVGLYLGVQSLICNQCKDAECKDFIEKKCGAEHDRCIDAAYYGHSFKSNDLQHFSIWHKTTQVMKGCTDKRHQNDICEKAHKKRKHGTCATCMEDKCNKMTGQELKTIVESGLKEDDDKKPDSTE